VKRSHCSSTKMDFMRLRNGSTNEDRGACFKIMIHVPGLGLG
jgi:hypothetical protein